MSTIATSSTPVFVQQTFAWDADHDSAVAVLPAPAPARRSLDSQESSVERTRNARPISRPAAPVATYGTSSSVRRGRCEHVGGVMATVLAKYGIGIDQLLAEIDGQTRS